MGRLKICHVPNILSFSSYSLSRLYLCSFLHGGVKVPSSTETGWRGRACVREVLPVSYKFKGNWLRLHGGFCMGLIKKFQALS